MSGFKLAPSKFAVARSSFAVSMGTPAGVNMKPQFDGTFKEAGAHLETDVLEHENGSRALVDTTQFPGREDTTTAYIAAVQSAAPR